MYIWTRNKLVSANHASASSNSGHVSSVVLFTFVNLQYESREQQTLAQFSPKTPKLIKVKTRFLLIYERKEKRIFANSTNPDQTLSSMIAITRLIARIIFRWLARVFCIVSQSNWRATVFPSKYALFGIRSPTASSRNEFLSIFHDIVIKWKAKNMITLLMPS